MLWRHNAIDLEAALRAAAPAPPFPAISDRAAWSRVRERLPDACDQIVAAAEAAARTAVPPLPATLFLEFDRRGERGGYERPWSERRAALAALVLAESLADDGRFLDPILDHAWAICEESSWVMPAHQRVLTDVERPVIDLGAAMTALELAECAHLVGGRLDPALSKRIRDEVDRRCLAPFLSRHDHWWLHASERRPVNNWTAVCVGGVVGAATYLEDDPARLAELIARGARSLADYLETFDQDGGSTEGPGYWSFGFGYYTVVADLVELRTGGRARFLDGEPVARIARFPLRTLLAPGAYANFSDCDRDVRLVAPLLAFLARRLDIRENMGLAAREGPAAREGLTWGLRELFWAPDHDAPAPVPARHDFFRGMHWLIARADPTDPDGLVLAAKGGHNGEMHNQNDVGNLIVHAFGESLVADLGRGRYTRAYFGPERYGHLVNSSLGHSVPVVNGCEQMPGRDFGAELLEQRASAELDLLALEIKGAYPADADLASLRREVALHRDGPRGWVSLDDRVRFATRAGTLRSQLTTFGRAELAGDAVVIHGDRGRLCVGFDGSVVETRLEVIPDVDLAEGPTAVTRIAFDLRESAREATISLRLIPER